MYLNVVVVSKYNYESDGLSSIPDEYVSKRVSQYVGT